MNGTVVKWFYDKGFGFIMPDARVAALNGRDLFVHHSQVPREAGERVSLVEGQRVEFQIADGSNGRPEAQQVRVLG